MSWEAVVKRGRHGPHPIGSPPSITDFVSVRANGIGFSASFAKKHVGEHAHVSIFVDTKKLRFGFRFHSEPDHNSYPLSVDGSGSGLVLQARKLYDQFPWLLEGIRQRFNPKRDAEADLWYITLPERFQSREQ